MIAAIVLAAKLTRERAIALPPRSHPVWVLLRLPQSLDPGADQNYDNLRIINNRGRQTPYVVDPPCPPAADRSAAVSDLGFVPGEYTEALLDTGTSGDLYSGISIQTSAATFFDRVQVSISDDRSTWRIVRSSALIYRVAGSGDPGSQTIDLPAARARWIRIRVMDGKALFPIEGATIESAQPAVHEPLQRLRASARVVSSRASRSTVITLDLGAPNVRTSVVRFRTTQPEFSRGVALLVSNDGKKWQYVDGGTIQRFARGRPVLGIRTPGLAGRFLRVEVANGSDVPLAGLHVQAYGPRRALVFIARSRRSYTLVQTHRTNAPAYDLGTLLLHDNPRVFVRARLAKARMRIVRPAPAPKAPSSLILSLAFGVAIAALGAVTLVTLRGKQGGPIA